MKYFRQVMTGINVKPLLNQIPPIDSKIWTYNNTWTDGKETVISQTGTGIARQYIELRYNKSEEGQHAHPKNWNKPPMYILTEAIPIIFGLMNCVQGEILGRVIISYMEPGEIIKPHVHKVQFGLPPIFETYQIPLQVDPGVIFRCGDGDCYMEPGTVWTFPNQVLHSVENNSGRPRFSMMIDIRPFTKGDSI